MLTQFSNHKFLRYFKVKDRAYETYIQDYKHLQKYVLSNSLLVFTEGLTLMYRKMDKLFVLAFNLNFQHIGAKLQGNKVHQSKKRKFRSIRSIWHYIYFIFVHNFCFRRTWEYIRTDLHISVAQIETSRTAPYRSRRYF